MPARIQKNGNANLERLQTRVKPILDLVDELRSMGVDKHVTLPQIAVMGDQSSGKSSVLEALSGIAFPRGAGLVTRCPTQVNMRSGTTWKATISCPALPDITQTLSEDEQEQIPTAIEEITNTLAGDDDDFPDWKDEKNYILIELVTPNAPELTIIDLPGIVRTTTEGQSKDVITTVDNMLEYFLRKPRTIILAVLPANVDLATSEILERASRVDPDGSRTIGVLTKPDLVDKGAEGEVIKVLRNVKRPLKHGYFMVKNRSQEQVLQNISFDEARKSEKDFFDNSPYAEAKRDNLGSLALSSALTDLLVSHIELALPGIKVEVQRALEEAHQRLLVLGQSPPEGVSAQRTTIFSVVREIIHDMRSEMSGDCSSRRLLCIERTHRKNFTNDVIATRPGFYGENDSFDGNVVTVAVVKVPHGPFTTALPLRPPNCGNAFYPILKEREENDIFKGEVVSAGYGNAILNDGVVAKRVGDVVKGFSYDKDSKQSTTPLGTVITVGYAAHGYTEAKVTGYVRYYRGDLRTLIESRRGRELPGFMNFKVFTSLMADYVGLWKKPTDLYETSVKGLMSEVVDSLTGEHAKSYPQLEGHLKKQLEKFFEGNHDLIARRLDKLLEQECSPSTENHYLWDTINKIRNERTEKKIKGIPDANVFNPQSQAKLDGYVKKTEIIAMLKSTLEGNTTNEAQEVQDMVDMLSAYWKLAVKRYIDQVAMTITDMYTHPDILEKLDAELHEKIINIGDEELAALFAQKRKVVVERAALHEKVEMMKNAKLLLENY